MRAVIQRVSRASCTVEGAITGSIEEGLLVLLGVDLDDTQSDMEWLAQKLVNLRIFSDEKGMMNKSIIDVGGSLLVISQFTLFAQTKKGNRPAFIKAAKPDKAQPMYEGMCAYLELLMGRDVARGKFGADMKIDLLNDGPVTIIMNTKDKENF